MRGMRAAILEQYGSTPVVADFAEEPTPDPGERLVEVTTASLNPNDLQRASGTFYGAKPPLPSIVGREGVGLLEDGSRVYFDLPRPPFGSLAERTVAGEERVFPVRDGVADELAVSLGVAGLAAWLALATIAELGAGERVLVLGAGGTVGQVAVQAARLLGASQVVAAARSESGLRRARELGADATVELGPECLAERLAASAPEGFDVVVDPLWGPSVAAALTATRPGARIVQLGEAGGAEAVFPAALVRGRQLRIVGHSIDAVDRTTAARAYATMLDHAAAGELTVATRTYPLAELPEAWEEQRRGPAEKLVVRIGDRAT